MNGENKKPRYLGQGEAVLILGFSIIELTI
jgi:hypothetical protein